jgi:hypothetical protein
MFSSLLSCLQMSRHLAMTGQAIGAGPRRNSEGGDRGSGKEPRISSGEIPRAATDGGRRRAGREQAGQS